MDQTSTRRLVAVGALLILGSAGALVLLASIGERRGEGVQDEGRLPDVGTPRLRGSPGNHPRGDGATGAQVPVLEKADERTVSLCGRVVDQESGSAVEGAVIYVDPAVTSDEPRALGLLDISSPPVAVEPNVVSIGSLVRSGSITDARGAFCFDVGVSPGFVVAFDADHVAKIARVFPGPGEMIIALERGGSLRGHVSSSQGYSLPGARVYIRPLRRDYDATFGRFVVADAEGAFIARGLDPGEYRVRVTIGCCERIVNVIVRRGEVSQAGLSLSRVVVVRVSVYGGFEQPPRNAEVAWSVGANRPESSRRLELRPALDGRGAPRGGAIRRLDSQNWCIGLGDAIGPVHLRLYVPGYRPVERVLAEGESASGRIDWSVPLVPEGE